MQLRVFMVIILAIFTVLSVPARAQEDETINEDHLPRLADLAEAQYINGILFPSFNGTGSEAKIPFVLKLALNADWYTYWRTPGDSGLAPTFDWSKSVNVKEAIIGWPAPQRMEQEGMYSFGYKGIVEIPVTLIPQEIGKPMIAALDMTAIVCNKICVPQTLNIRNTVPSGAAVQSPYYNYFKEIQAKVPNVANENLKLETAVLGKDALVFTLYSKNGFGGVDIFVESNDIILSAPPVVEKDADNAQMAVIKIAAPQGTDLTQVLFGKKISATAVVGDQSTEKAFSF